MGRISGEFNQRVEVNLKFEIGCHAYIVCLVMLVVGRTPVVSVETVKRFTHMTIVPLLEWIMPFDFSSPLQIEGTMYRTEMTIDR